MEKYRKFSDAATSCNPFLPVNLLQATKSMTVGNVIISCLSFSLLLARLPLLLASLMLLTALDILVWVPLLSTLIVIPLLRPIASWVALLGLGVICPISATRADFRRLQVKKPTGTGPSYNVTLSTFHGFLDVLVHAVCSRPVRFGFKALDGTFTSCRTVLGAISLACKSPLTTLKDSNKIESGVLFVSPSPTNGLGILKLHDALISSEGPIQLSSLNYSCTMGNHYPHHLVGSMWVHVFKLMTRNVLCSVNVNQLPEAMELDGKRIKTLLARLGRPTAAETDIDPKTYIDFLEYWEATQSVDYAARKKVL